MNNYCCLRFWQNALLVYTVHYQREVRIKSKTFFRLIQFPKVLLKLMFFIKTWRALLKNNASNLNIVQLISQVDNIIRYTGRSNAVTSLSQWPRYLIRVSFFRAQHCFVFRSHSAIEWHYIKKSNKSYILVKSWIKRKHY